jgi:Holliday junction resolvase-like predicted endonuclease
VARRFRTRRGELDLVTRSGRHLYFIEVKTRRADEGVDRFGGGFEAITWRRRRTMHTLARTLLARRPALDGLIPHYAVLTVEESDDRRRVSFLPDAFDGPA